MPKNINVQVIIDKTPMSKQEKILRVAQFVALIYKWDKKEKLKEEKAEK